MRLSLLLVFVLLSSVARAQFLMDMIDTTNHLIVSGYFQPQYQVASKEGVKNYSGGDFSPSSNNRFMFRRSRLKVEYLNMNEHQKPSLQFVFQLDGTERGIAIRDVWGRFFENKYELFSFTVGMFARPFSYEVNLSSSKRETPERGRMSQILMKTERDMGAMISFEPRKKDHPLRYLKIDAGFFNGPGLTASGDYDSHKDFISRIGLKPYPLSKKIRFSIAASYLDGGILQSTPNIYSIRGTEKNFRVDDSPGNVGKIAPRKYYGADAQVKIKGKAGFTELRGEFMSGKQTAFANSTTTPVALPAANESLYIRKFNGAYFYLLQNIFNDKNQVVIKYDWYDPNQSVSAKDIGKTGSNLTAADIKYSTLGFGFNHKINDNAKITFWYDRVWNEKTNLPGYTTDISDNIFTCRLQFSF